MSKYIRFFGILCFFILAVIAPVNLWLKTSSAKKLITSFVERTVNNHLGVNVKISGVNFSLPLDLKVDNVLLYGNDKGFIRIKNLHVDLSPSFLVSSKIYIKTISASEIYLSSIPDIHSNKSINQNDFAKDVIVQNINFNKIILNQSIAGKEEEIVIKMNSHLAFDSRTQNLDFFLENELLSNCLYLQQKSNLSLAGTYNFAKEVLDITSLDIISDIMRISGNFQLDQLSDKVVGSFEYSSNILERALLKLPIQGKSSGEINISGSTSKQEVDISGITIFDLYYNDRFNSKPITWNSNFTIHDNIVKGAILGKQTDITARTDFLYENQMFHLQNFNIITPEFKKTANITYNFKNSIITGSADIKGEISEIPVPFLPFVHNGFVDINVICSSIDNKTQALKTKGQIKNLQTKFGSASLVDMSLNIDDLWSFNFAPSTLEIAFLNVDDIKVQNISLNIKSHEDSLNVDGNLKDNRKYPIDIKFSSILSYGKNLLHLVVNKLDGTVNFVPIKNTKDILFHYDNNSIYQHNSFKIGDGNLESNIEIYQNSIKANANIRSLPSAIFKDSLPENFKNTKITGNLAMEGNNIKPSINANIEFNEITDQNSPDKLSLKFYSSVNKNRTNITGEVIEKDGKIAHFFAKLPTNLQFQPFLYEINANEDVSANLSILKNFNLLSMFPMQAGHYLKGHVEGNIEIGGNINSLKTNGNINITDARYRNTKYGVLLEGITTNIILNKNQISFNKLIAKDKDKNILEASGYVNLDKDKNFKIFANTNKLKLINTPYLQGELKGNVTIDGDKNKAVSTGDIILGPMEFKIPERFEQNIPELHVVEILTGTDAKNDIIDEDPYKLALDLNLKASKKVYVRGWGVDTELKGDLHVTGYSNNPLISGSLKSVHGKYKEFGKILDVKTGTLFFDGPIPPSPYLNIIGLYNVSGYEIRLVLSGSIQNPDLSIESTPALSQDEALSMLLFGQDSSNISTFQALQLANGARRISGHGGGFDQLDIGRNIIGVDSINIKSDPDKEDSNSVSAGKYLNNKLYFEVESGQQENSTKTKVEVQLTPKISVESTAAQDGNNSVGINWRFDY